MLNSYVDFFIVTVIYYNVDTWDKELEIIAQRWANQCSRGHDSCRNVERFSVGQNIASSSNKSTLEEMIQSWYNEIANFHRRYISTQVFQIDTTAIVAKWDIILRLSGPTRRKSDADE
ncbi:venom allergen 3-like [Temnothorax americanus]|uniref:venom allergen 3-like n=1 Tax=Temnothorax americanus TaxID=1964332 RepID=UPI00406860D8